MASREREDKGSQREPNGTKRKPNGSQRGAKRVPKQSQTGARMKKTLPKHPLRNNSEQVGKKDAKRMTIYTKRVPKWNQNRCPKLFKHNEKTGNETTHENHDK